MPHPRPPLQDQESFSALYNSTYMIIFRFISGLHGGPHEEVEELTSDTFLRAWNGRNRFSGNNHDALCWLITIARNLVIDSYRKNQKKFDLSVTRVDDEVLDNFLFPLQNTPEEQIIVQEQYLRLWNSLQKLSIDRREMLILRYVVGWQVKQVAAFLNMDENTVSVYIKRTLESIRHDWTTV